MRSIRFLVKTIFLKTNEYAKTIGFKKFRRLDAAPRFLF